MSVGNLPTQGDKRNNWTWQNAVLQLLGQIDSSITALPGVDYETRTTTYRAIAAGPGYIIDDIIVRYDIIDVITGLVSTTVWFNQTQQTVIVAPAPANIIPISDATSVTVINTSANPVPVTLPAAISRIPSVVNIPSGSVGSTTAGVQELSILVVGGGNTVGGVAIPSGTILNYRAKNNDTVGALAYTTGGGANRLIVTYLT